MNIPELETPRLKLIALSDRHLNDLFAIFGDGEAMKYWDAPQYKRLEETKNLLNFFHKRLKNGTGIFWGICLKENPVKVIGLFTYNDYKEDRNANIGYIFAREYWGKGLATEAIKVCVEYGFNQLKVHRIEAGVEPGNIASETVLQKIGFTREGLLREKRFYKEKYQSLIMYGLLKTDKRFTD